MPNYKYIKSGFGTATGDVSFTSLQTGTFASIGAASVYADLETARKATVTPADDDYYLCSHLHAHTETAVNSEFDGPAIVVSVSDTNCDQYLKGALEKTGPTHADIYFGGTMKRFSARGMTFQTFDNFQVTDRGVSLYFDECEFIFDTNSSSDEFLQMTSSNAQKWHFHNCGFDFANSGQGFQIKECHFVMDGCYGISGNTLQDAFIDLVDSSTGGPIIEIYNTDLASLVATSGRLLTGIGESDETHLLKMRNCKFPTSMTINAGGDPTTDQPKWQWDIAGCHSADGYYSLRFRNQFGEAVDDTAQYMTTSDAKYDGTNRFSIKITTTTHTGDAQPFCYKLGVIPASDLATSNQTVSVELVSSDSALEDGDVWIELEIQNDTDQALHDLVNSRGATSLQGGAGTALTSSIAVWQTTTNTEYSISKDLGAFTNVDNTNVTVYVYVAKPSITVNFDIPTIAAT